MKKRGRSLFLVFFFLERKKGEKEKREREGRMNEEFFILKGMRKDKRIKE